MTADWLYPLSSKSDYYFEYDGGHTADTGPSSFEQMVRLGAVDDRWGAYKNWRKMRKDDRMWAYYGSTDGDLGVVGLASIVAVNPPAKPGRRAEVILSWDRPATTRLLSNPFPAQAVREHIPHPQGAAWAVPPELAKTLLRHSRSAARKPSPPIKGKYGTAVSSTISYTPPKSVRAHLRHDALLRPFERRFETAGWKNAAFDIGSKRADLVVQRGNDLVVVEAKTISKSTSDAVRAAFAQLCEYAWLYTQRENSVLTPLKWALFESEPDAQAVQFLEDHDIVVSWSSKSKRRFFHGPRSGSRAFDAGL